MVSLSLKKAMIMANIRKGCSATCIWPLNSSSMDDKTRPSEVFVNVVVEVNDVNEVNEQVEEVLGERIP